MKMKIVAAILDTRQLTLYKDTGETVILEQGDTRLRPILDTITPLIATKGFAEIDLPVRQNGFAQFQEQSKVVRFFKVARDKLTGLFGGTPTEATVGKVPPPSLEMAPKVSESAIEEILAHAVPVSGDSFNSEGLSKQGPIEEDGKTSRQIKEVKHSHTVVAHVDGKLIPDMERIESHFARAAKLGSTVGVEKFLKRLASVIEERSHSVEDLLKHMERADMPVADDGSIVIFKVLNKKGDHFVDCHTGNVPQKVGSYVCMDISLVDRNRNNECSNGLHVARRGYIGSFSGDACVIAKLAPEDVVTVPSYDANKMRVMGYHILEQLSDDMFRKLQANRPITELPEGKALLGRVLAGQHTPVLEKVCIRGQRGTDIIIEPIDAPVVEPVEVEVVEAEALQNPEESVKDTPLDPKSVAKKVAALSRKDQAQKLLRAYKKNPSAKNRQKLLDFKKQVKLGWEKLGIDPDWADN